MIEEYKKELELPEVCEQLGEHFDGLLNLMTAPAVVYAGVLRDIISGDKPTKKILNMVTSDNYYDINVDLFRDSTKCIDPLLRPRTKEQPPKHGAFHSFDKPQHILSTKKPLRMSSFSSRTIRTRNMPPEDLVRSKYKLFGGGTITLIGAYNKASCVEEEAINVVRMAPFVCSGIIMDKHGEIFEVIPDAYEHCKNKIVRLNTAGITHRTGLDFFKKQLKMFKDSGWKSNIVIKSVQRKITKLQKSSGMHDGINSYAAEYSHGFYSGSSGPSGPSWSGTNVGRATKAPSAKLTHAYKSKWTISSLLSQYGDDWDNNLRRTADVLGLGLSINSLGEQNQVTITMKSEEAARRLFADCPRSKSKAAVAQTVTGMRHPKYSTKSGKYKSGGMAKAMSNSSLKFDMPTSKSFAEVHYEGFDQHISDMSDADQSASLSTKFLQKKYGTDWQNKFKNACEMIGTSATLGHDVHGTLKVYPKSSKAMREIITLLDQHEDISSDIETIDVREQGGKHEAVYVKYDPPTTYNEEPHEFTYTDNPNGSDREMKQFHTHADHVTVHKVEEVEPERVTVEENDDFTASMNPTTGQVSIELSEQVLRKNDVDAVLESLMGKLGDSDFKRISDALDDGGQSSIGSMKKLYNDFMTKKKRRKKNVPKRKKQGKSR